jgi:hypothetical protein
MFKCIRGKIRKDEPSDATRKNDNTQYNEGHIRNFGAGFDLYPLSPNCMISIQTHVRVLYQPDTGIEIFNRETCRKFAELLPVSHS